MSLELLCGQRTELAEGKSIGTATISAVKVLKDAKNPVYRSLSLERNADTNYEHHVVVGQSHRHHWSRVRHWP